MVGNVNEAITKKRMPSSILNKAKLLRYVLKNAQNATVYEMEQINKLGMFRL